MNRRGIMKTFAAIPAMLHVGGADAAMEAAKGLGTQGLTAGAIVRGPQTPASDLFPANALREENHTAFLTKKLIGLQQMKALGLNGLVTDRYLHSYQQPNHYETFKSISPAMKFFFARRFEEDGALDRMIAETKNSMWKEGAYALLPKAIADFMRHN